MSHLVGVDVAGAMRYVGWLLRVNRRLGPDEALRSGRTFALAFRGDGERPLHPSHVTRWENGDLPAPRGVLRRYEELLRLNADSLVTVADAAVRTATDGPPPQTVLRPDPDDPPERLHDLLDRATGGAPMTGTNWGELTELLTARPGLVLHPRRLWREVTDRLLYELVAAMGSEWLQRQEAMCRLIEHRTARRYAVASCVELAGDRSSPAVIEPLSLLDVTSDPAANRFVLGQIEHPDSERAMHGALLAAIRKVNGDHFDGPESDRLIGSIGFLMSDPALASPLVPLVVAVGQALARRRPDAEWLASRLPAAPVAHRIWTGRLIADPHAARLVSTRIATRAESLLDAPPVGGDGALATLLEEALFLPNPDQRLVACMLIAATPYRLPVARVLLAEVTADLSRRGDTYPVAASLRALTQLGVDIHRPLVYRVLTRPGSPAGVRHAAAWAIPFCSGRYPEAAWRQIYAAQLAVWLRSPLGLSESILNGIAYGIGTEGHRTLLAEIRDDPLTPPTPRTTATWHLRAA